MAGARLDLDGWILDLRASCVRRENGAEVELSEQEVRILETLLGSPGIPRARAELLHEIWGDTAAGDTRAVDKAMFRLRSKLERDPKKPRFLKGVRGLGYMLEPPPLDPSPVRERSGGVVSFASTRVDLARLEVLGPKGFERLTPLEGKLLRYLLERSGVIVGEDELLRSVWGYREGVSTRAIDHLVRRLRRKIEDKNDPRRILETVRGKGWRLSSDPSTIPRDSLPAWADAFFGRTAELTEAAGRILGGERVLALVGPPGVGKTRLAVKIIRELQRSGQPTRAWSVSLAGVSSSRALVSALAGAVHTTKQDEAGLLAVLDRADRSHVVLDDADELDGSSFELLGRWTERIEGLVFVMTSTHRAPTSFDVPPLALDDAMRLYRARAGSRGRVLSDDVVRSAVQAADCLPLAIEIAARSPHGVGHSGPADGLGRTIERAWNALDDASRTALEALAAFPAPFDFEAATRVAGPGVSDALETLYHGSLVRTHPDAHGRAWFSLYHSIRRFALSRRDPSEPTTFVQWARAYAVEEMPRIGTDAGARFARHQENLEAAARLAVRDRDREAALDILHALVEVGRFRGVSVTVEDLVDEAAATWPEPRSLAARARIRERRLRIAEAREDAHALPEGVARELLLSTLAHHEARFDLAIAHARSACALAEPGSAWFAHARFSEASAVYAQRVDVTQAIAMFRESATLHRKGGRIAEAALVLVAIGHALTHLRRSPEAIAALDEALGYYRLLDSPAGICAALHVLGRAHGDLGDTERAKAELSEAVAIAASIGDVNTELMALVVLGSTHLRTGSLDEADETVVRGLRRVAMVGDPSPAVAILLRNNSVSADMSRGRLAAAAATSAINVEEARAHGLWVQAVEALANQGTIELLRRSYGAARPLLDDARSLAERLETPYYRRIDCVRALAAYADGDQVAFEGILLTRPTVPTDDEEALIWSVVAALGSPIEARPVLAAAASDPLHASSDLVRFHVHLVEEILHREAGVTPPGPPP